MARRRRRGGADLEGAAWLLVAVVALGIVVRACLPAAEPPPGSTPIPAVATPAASGSTAPTGSPGDAPVGSPDGSAAPGGGGSGDPGAAGSASPGPGGSLAALVAALPVVPERRAGYEREAFEHWVDADGDGCDTRREVLLAEALDAPAVGDGCRLSGGRWRSAYDGIVVTDAAELDIDHVVALAEAWDSGAWAWSEGRREAFANDLAVPWALIAVTAAANRAKRDLDPADWLPPRAESRCGYLVAWVAVKVRWGLAVDAVERVALARLAGACAAEPVPAIPRA